MPFERRAHILGQRPGVGDKRTLAAMRAAPDWRLHRSWPILAKAAEAVLVYHVAIGSDRVKNKIRPTPNWYLRFRCSAAYPSIKRRPRPHTSLVDEVTVTYTVTYTLEAGACLLTSWENWLIQRDVRF